MSGDKVRELTEDAHTIALLAEAVGGIAKLCESVGLEGFAIWKCDKCPEWHCGAASKEHMAFSAAHGSSLDPYTAANESLATLVMAQRFKQSEHAEAGQAVKEMLDGKPE